MNMQIKNLHSNTLNFQSRKKEIRDADKIMRNSMNNYPVLSSSKVYYYDIYYDNPVKCNEKKQKTYNKIMDLRDKIYWNSSLKQIHDVMTEVKDCKVGNCAEMTQIMRAAFIANGYKDVKDVALYKKSDNLSERCIDHEFLLVNAGENANLEDLSTINKHAFVVDPWVGFVDYVPKAVIKYKDFFPQCRDYKQADGQLMKNKLYFLDYKDDFKIHKKDCKKFAKKYPELVLFKKDEPRKKFLGLF